jgi:hypothetical protein
MMRVSQHSVIVGVDPPLAERPAESLPSKPTDGQQIELWDIFRDRFPKTYRKLCDAWQAADEGKPDAVVRGHHDSAAKMLLREQRRTGKSCVLTKNKAKLEIIFNWPNHHDRKSGEIEDALRGKGITMKPDSLRKMMLRFTERGHLRWQSAPGIRPGS